ncbi:DMT family transporter [Microbacteriaceae bacterium 4G12]
MKLKQSKGIFFGLFSGIAWALDTVLIGMVLSSTLFLSTEQVIFLAPLVSTFLHDALSSFWMMIYMAMRGELKTTFSKLKTRSGRFVMLGALAGGPIGMTFYVLAVKYIGASYTASISAIYPAIGAFFAFVFLKERLSIRGWIGLAISIFFIFILGYSSGELNASNYLLGFLFVTICIFGWGLECVICAYGMKDDEVTPEQALQIRQLVSAVTYGVLILPAFNGYGVLKQVLFSSEALFIAVIALVGTASYVFYYKAIYTIGPTRAMALNITYSAWAIVLSALILHTSISPKLVLCSVAILVGAIMTVADPRELLNLRKKDYRSVG